MRQIAATIVMTLSVSAAGAHAQRPTPGAALSFVALTAGDEFTCGLTSLGTAYCWGRNEYQPRAVEGGFSFRTLEAGSNFVCGITTWGAAYCWGSNATGALGTEAPLETCSLGFRPPPDLLSGCSQRPVPVAGGLTFTTVASGNGHSCGLTPPGELFCWGMSSSATGRTIHPTPHKVSSDRRYLDVSADFYQVCALDEAGAVWCWKNWRSDEPVPVTAPEAFARISRGWGHTCGLTTTGVAYCWGDNTDGQLGTGRTPEPHEKIAEPTRVSGGHRFREIRAGFRRTCGITVERALYCWGNRAGERGRSLCFNVDSYSDCTPAPIRLTRESFRSVAIGDVHTCAVTVGGVGYCWGADYYGRFGRGEGSRVEERPVRIEWRAVEGFE